MSPHLHIQSARESGCLNNQLERFIQAGALLQPKQLAASPAARLCDHDGGPTSIGFGGARGGGKSYWLIAQMGVDDRQRFPGLKCLLLRKVGKSNLESFEDLRRRLLLRLKHEFNTTRGILTFQNDSRIIIGHFQDEKDIDKYLGLEYDVIGIEEATTLTSRKFHDITTCNRTSKTGWRPRIYSTTNPGNVGHAWYKSKYVVPFQCGTQSDTRFIPATVNDNSFVNAGYKDALASLSGWQRRAWLDGDWDIAAGQFFTSFRREIHVIDEFDHRRGVEWFASLDYGFTHYTVVLLGCRDSDGNIFIIDEHAERNWIPQRHAEAVKAMLKRHQLALEGRYEITLARFVAGADVFGKQSDGTSVASQYRQLGISLRPANTDRVNGWASINHRLGDEKGKIKPTLFFHRRCSRLIDCIPMLQHDPNRPEDVLKTDPDETGIGGDDAADALRYMIATQPRRIYERRLIC